MPSSANFLLIAGAGSLALREALEQRPHPPAGLPQQGLGAAWLRVGLQTRSNNRRIIRALQRFQSTRV